MQQVCNPFAVSSAIGFRAVPEQLKKGSVFSVLLLAFQRELTDSCMNFVNTARLVANFKN